MALVTAGPRYALNMIDWGFTPLSAKASFAATSGFYIDAANGDRDAFYVANGRYTIIDTCNQWTGRALRLGGAPVAPWTPFSFLVLWHLPPNPA